MILLALQIQAAKLEKIGTEESVLRHAEVMADIYNIMGDAAFTAWMDAE